MKWLQLFQGEEAWDVYRMSGREVRPIECGGTEPLGRICSLLPAWPPVLGKEVYFCPNLRLCFHCTLAEIHPIVVGTLPLNACGGARDGYQHPWTLLEDAPTQSHTHASCMSFKSCWRLCLGEARQVRWRNPIVCSCSLAEHKGVVPNFAAY